MRKVLIAGAAISLVVTGLIGGSPAEAGVGPSQACKAGPMPGAPIYAELLNTGAYVGVRYGLPNPTDFSLNVCFSDRPYGTASVLTGGIVHLRFFKVGPNTYDVYLDCAGDDTLLGTPNNCDGTVSTATTVHFISPTSGASTQLYVYLNGSTLVVGPTGADSGAVNATTGANPDVTYTGVCASAAGVVVPGTCTGGGVDARVASGDLPRTPPSAGCLVSIAGTCHVPMPAAQVEAFADSSNPTEVYVAGVRVVPDPGRVCVGFGC